MVAIRTGKDTINIAHWNANGLRNNISELRDFIKLHRIDIMLVNETRLTPGAKVYMPGYNAIRKDRSAGKLGGGVLIFIHMDIRYIEIELQTKAVEAVAVKITDGLIISSVYNPPQSKININELNSIFKSGNKVLLLYPYSGALPSVFDIGLEKNIDCDIELNVVDDLSSDHNPVKITLDKNVGILKHTRSLLNYKSADWSKFRSILGSELILDRYLETKHDLDRSVDVLLGSIKEATNKAILRKHCKLKHIPLPPYIRNLIKYRNALRKLYQKTLSNNVRKIKNKLSNKITKEIASFENKNWQSKLTNLNIKDNSLWKMAKNFTKKNKNYIPTLYGVNGLAVTDYDKANTLAEHYESVHHLTNIPGDDTTEQQVSAKYEQIANELVDKKQIVLVTPREIKKAVMRTGSRKAPGVDEIQNIILKNLPRKAFVQLTYIYNACLKLAYFPNT